MIIFSLFRIQISIGGVAASADTYNENVVKLVHVVNALGEELSLHLVDDLVHTVSPVGHCVRFLLILL